MKKPELLQVFLFYFMRGYWWLFILFLVSCAKADRKNTVIGIQPYDDFPKAKTDTISKTIENFYNVRTVISPTINHDKSTFINIKSPRYRADKIIRLQKENLPDSVDFVIGLTTRDISATKKENGKTKQPESKYEDWGIMGLAYCPGKSCVVSTFRIGHPDKNTHFSRLKKITVHELGHNFGLPHCPNKKCVMTDAVESVATIDNTLLELCDLCKQKLK